MSNDDTTEAAGSGRIAFTKTWVRHVAGTYYAPLTAGDAEIFAEGLTRLLTEALFTEPFNPALPDEVGRLLINSPFTTSDTLAQSLLLVRDELLACLGIPDDEDARSRLMPLQSRMVMGYVDELQRRIVMEQQTIAGASFDARDQAALAQQESEAKFHALYVGAGIGIAIADIDGHITHANQTLRTMLDFTLEELCEQEFTDCIPAEEVPEVWEAYNELVESAGEQEHIRLSKPVIRRDGTLLWTNLSLSLIRDEEGRHHTIVVMFEDVTDRHLLETRLRYLATHDPLTQLPNRVLLLENLDQALTNSIPGARVGLCFLDLDGFKVVNDSFGHGVGDQMLVEVAGRLDKCVTTTGHMVARMGGDEFIILITNSTGADEVTKIAERVQRALSRPFFVDGNDLSVSASIGIIERPVKGANASDMLRAADITLYWAKAAGKGRWALFDPIRNANEVARYTMSATMPAALAGCEFFVDYEPVIRLADGVLIGVEALLKWRHPKVGVLDADRFIGLAEETGLIVSLGRWALQTACEQLRRWEHEHRTAGMFVSVNIGARQAQDPRLIDDVASVLEETGLEPDRLQLSLTRAAMTDAPGEPPRGLRMLAAKGVHIALHDFGPSYSDFTYLRSLPVRELKIASALVSGLGPQPNPVDMHVIESMISLAHRLDLTTTARGIESAIQMEQLRGLGCDHGQGSFLARPGPAVTFSQLLVRTGPDGRLPSIIPPG